MDLPKAIEIAELNIKEAGKQMPPDVKDALEILITAGNFVLQMEKVLKGENLN